MKSCRSTGPSAYFLAMVNVPVLVAVPSVLHATLDITVLFGVFGIVDSDYGCETSWPFSHKTSPRQISKVPGSEPDQGGEEVKIPARFLSRHRIRLNRAADLHGCGYRCAALEDPVFMR